MTRCFIGVLISKELKKSIESIKKELEGLPMKCKFVEIENLHICFSFLGEVEDEKIDYISKALDSICNNFSSFEVSVSGIKAIPSENYIRVLALDVLDESKILQNITKEIGRKIGGDAKPPHLTLCRIKSISNKQILIEKIEELKKKEIGRMMIKSVQLIKSELKRAGPVYSIIHESKLKY